MFKQAIKEQRQIFNFTGSLVHVKKTHYAFNHRFFLFYIQLHVNGGRLEVEKSKTYYKQKNNIRVLSFRPERFVKTN